MFSCFYLFRHDLFGVSTNDYLEFNFKFYIQSINELEGRTVKSAAQNFTSTVRKSVLAISEQWSEQVSTIETQQHPVGVSSAMEGWGRSKEC